MSLSNQYYCELFHRVTLKNPLYYRKSGLKKQIIYALFFISGSLEGAFFVERTCKTLFLASMRASHCLGSKESQRKKAMNGRFFNSSIIWRTIHPLFLFRIASALSCTSRENTESFADSVVIFPLTDVWETCSDIVHVIDIWYRNYIKKQENTLKIPSNWGYFKKNIIHFELLLQFLKVIQGLFSRIHVHFPVIVRVESRHRSRMLLLSWELIFPHQYQELLMHG